MAAWLAFDGVGKHYGKGAARVSVLEGVTFELPRGAIAAVAGPSGSGKSTLLNLAGLLDTADAGTVALFGEPVPAAAKQRERLRRERLGFIFQSFNLVPTLSARENVELAVLLTEPDAKHRRRRAETALGEVGLGGLGERRPHELSGGQQQRVGIARALVRAPDLILADEPTANLDRAAADGVVALLRDLNARAGTTILLSSHDPAVAAAADFVLKLEHGRLVTRAGPRSILEVAA